MDDTRKPLKIAYLTSLDPQDRRSWSGIYYYIAQALQEHCGDVAYIGPIRTVEELSGKVLNKGSQILIKKKFPYYISFPLAKKYAKIAAKRLARQAFDVIVAPAGATITAFLETDIPIVLVEDVTFALLHNYYPQYSNFPDTSVREANIIMDLAIKKASLLIFSSAWAARSAIEDYHADKERVYVIPFGANFENVPPKALTWERKKTDCCKLLFVGANWQRKGGDIAFETLLKLEEMDIQGELIVCGCTPPKTLSHKKVTVIPFLDKNDERQRKELEKLFALSDFLLLPTRGDCTPIVFCEASAFGLPIITTDTGGISEMVKNGVNGFALPYSARGGNYAEVIARIYRDERQYAEMARASRAAFDERLNWSAWGTAVKSLIAELLSQEYSSIKSMGNAMR